MNHRSNTRRKHRSIFIRLFFVLLATMGLVYLVIGGSFGLFSGKNSIKTIESNIQQYAVFIAREIGTPPDTIRALKLAETYKIYIQYKSNNFNWSSHPEFPKIFSCVGPGSRWRKPVFISNEDGSQYTLIWRIGPFMGIHRHLLIGILFTVTLIFLGAHGYLRHILRPIQWLRKGVDEISRGNLNVTIPKDRNDELGRLTEAFNDMIQRIKSMIKSRDQLLLDVSHELRSPLTRMKVALEFIRESEKKSAILSDIAEIETMITEILETERLDAEHGRLNRTDTDLIAMINETAREFHNSMPGIQLPDLPTSVMLSLDAERIRTVLKNIFENAIKFSQLDSQPVKVSVDESENSVSLLIQDNGISIPENQIPYVFEPFFKVDRSRSKETAGYGLGLHLCKKIMEAHGGQILIRNNENDKGVTVMLEFVK